jgi:hypothetical protein
MSESNAVETTDKTCAFQGARKIIDWLNVVDDFKIKDHPNFLPRWGFLVIVLAIMALT